MYRCPICAAPLTKEGRTYKCENHHSYDISKRGYVNLLPPKTSVPGDNKEMVLARRDFLSKDHYAPFSDGVNRILSDALAAQGASLADCTILDAGCGEGYYTARIPAKVVYGADISKEAVDHACRRTAAAETHYCAASVFHLPYQDSGFEAAISLFAPICGEELRRVLKPDGVLLVGAPGKEHLWELKAAIYDEPYENDEIPPEIGGFTLAKAEKIRYTMHIASSADLTALFWMTPYAYHTPKEGMERLAALEQLDVTAEFMIYLYKIK